MIKIIDMNETKLFLFPPFSSWTFSQILHTSTHGAWFGPAREKSRKQHVVCVAKPMWHQIIHAACMSLCCTTKGIPLRKKAGMHQHIIKKEGQTYKHTIHLNSPFFRTNQLRVKKSSVQSTPIILINILFLFVEKLRQIYRLERRDEKLQNRSGTRPTTS